MKKLFLLPLLMVLLFQSCQTTVTLIGSHDVISNVNIDKNKSVEVSRKSSNIDFKSIKQKENRSEYLVEAIDKAVARDTTGNGVYLINTKVYMIHKTIPFIGWKAWFYVDGDVVRYK